MRTVEIGKGNLFCTTAYIQEYADSVFRKYFPQCQKAKDDIEEFVKVFSDNYGDLNALHPFREGNGRTQREFARLVCMDCGFDFNLSCATHREMLEASKLSFDKADSSLFIRIFSRAIVPWGEQAESGVDTLNILTSDDLTIGSSAGYEYYEHGNADMYSELYLTKIMNMNDEEI